jgi:hypothetical protein
MIRYLQRYFSLTLMLSLVAPLWLLAAGSDAALFQERFRDALIWSGFFLALWALITWRRGFQVRGAWRRPSPQEAKLYTCLLLGVWIIDLAPKRCFFAGTARTRSN